jgi:carboxyl-terminal processing protease
MLGNFREFLQKSDLKIDEKDFEKDLSYIKTRMKATFARSFWGNDGWYPTMLQVDAQFQKAMGLFPEAEKIAELN